MPGIFRWIKKLVTKEQTNKKVDPKAENVSQRNINSTTAIKESTNGVQQKQTDSTSKLADQISTLQITEVQNVGNSEKSNKLVESISNDQPNCVQSNGNGIGTKHCVVDESDDDSFYENIFADASAPTDTFPNYVSAPTDTFRSDDADDSVSGESDDESFYKNLFANSKPEYVTAQTDTFPCDDDSDSEIAVSHTVKFFIDDGQWQQPMAEYNGIKYRIGQLDLTTEEFNYLKAISETSIQLDFNPSDIIVHQNRLNIKRIEEQQKTFGSKHANNSWFSVLNLVRIQFSRNEPLAKYENKIYFVGSKLHEEYMYLLWRANKIPGTAIRLCRDRINVNEQSQTLDVFDSIAFDKQSEICVISAQNDSNTSATNHLVHSQFKRYMLNSEPFEILEVEPMLLHSSEFDDCTEIYAEIDFPFNQLEKVLKSADKDSVNIEDEEESDDDENTSLEMLTLKPFTVTNEIKNMGNRKYLSKAELQSTKFGQMCEKKTLRKDVSDYINGYKMMIHFEEDEQTRFLEKFNQTDIKFTYHMDRQFYFPVNDIELAGAIEESILERFVLKPKYSKPKAEIWGQVLRVRERKIYIEIFPETFNAVRNGHKNELYEIIFKVNRMPFQLQHFALEFVKEEQLFTRLIDNSYYQCKNAMSNGRKGIKQPKLEYEGTMLNGLNAEQQTAVKNIVGKVDTVCPYVLFGPPGTGKTRTLVATIEQIIRTTNQNVLVCANSNAASDEIAERLIDVLREGEMYRFYAKSYKNERINHRIAQHSNYSRERIIYPPLKYLYKYRVFVCTLCSAGCLTRARKDASVWRPDHFGYVIIDECASAHETMCLIPIAGLCTSKKEIHAKIVLAGDPKQLDAVTKSDRAKKLGFNTSWMEQLCSTNLYSRDANTGQFNEKYITQLVKNYRSHPHILSVPNELFYENKLEPHAAESQTNWYLNSSFLPSKMFPIKFISVQGKCQQSIEHSWYNDAEIDEVIKVIKQLLPSKSKKFGLKQITQIDIGVVTPYRKQCHRICQRFRRLNFDQVTVGTAEVFQGKEKPVMIISTVRSNGELGFVKDPRRLNVVITRAKCLVVIIGDPHTLKLDNNWLRLMEYCYKNNSFIQSHNVFSMS